MTQELSDEADDFFEQAHEIVKKHHTLVYHALVRDIASALKQVRRETREECAKECEEWKCTATWEEHSKDRECCDGAHDAARAIRALEGR